MPNHVHMLVDPLDSIPRVMQSLKGCQANKILNRTGQPFWQKESYDHWVRDARELANIARYIENNPVKAGFVRTPEDWPWSSAVRT